MRNKTETEARELRKLSIDSLEYRGKTEEELPKIEGYAALFNSETEIRSPWDAFREVIAPGAFKRALDEDQDVRALVDHNPSLILARTKAGTLTLTEDKRGLKVSFTIPDTQTGRDVAENIRLGNISQMSFGFIVRKATWTEEAEKLDLRTIEDVDLFDVSVVTYPAFEETEVYLRSLESAGKSRPEKRDHKGSNDLLRKRIQIVEKLI